MVCKIKDSEDRPITMQKHINRTSLTMEVDTGCSFYNLSADPQEVLLQHATIKLWMRLCLCLGNSHRGDLSGEYPCSNLVYGTGKWTNFARRGAG